MDEHSQPSTKPFTDVEDQQLLAFVKGIGTDFNLAATILLTRTPAQYSKRYKELNAGEEWDEVEAEDPSRGSGAGGQGGGGGGQGGRGVGPEVINRITEGLMKILDDCFDEVADRVADRVADSVADRVADRVAERMRRQKQ